MFCTNCGKEIEDDCVYCNYCGNKILTKENILNITSRELCIMLLAIGLIISIFNVINDYIVEKNMSGIVGNLIFILVFAVSIILLWKSKKIGGMILVTFVLFKIFGSIYYYKIYYAYSTTNLIIDEIFYLAIISLTAIYWNKLE